MDIENWLRGLALQQYVTAFRDNAIDAEILPELTDADLDVWSRGLMVHASRASGRMRYGTGSPRGRHNDRGSPLERYSTLKRA